MQVSFVIPLFNCLDLTRACVESLQRTVPAGLSHEIILVDDGSTDGTRSWLSTLDTARGPFRVILNERNLGYAGANNRGVAQARGELLVLLNNDLILTRRWLQPMLAVHRRLGARAGCVGNVQRNARTGAIDHTGLVVNLQGKPEHDTRFPRWPGHTLRRAAAVTGACLLTRRDLFLGLGGFDEGYCNGGEDIDLCFRASAQGKRHAVALRSVIYHHISASPGRKRRDEENSRRLTLRWRDRLAALAARGWCQRYLEQHWAGPTANPDHAFARAAFWHAYHLRTAPPSRAIDGMQIPIERELAHWRVLLDGAPPLPPAPPPAGPPAPAIL